MRLRSVLINLRGKKDAFFASLESQQVSEGLRREGPGSKGVLLHCFFGKKNIKMKENQNAKVGLHEMYCKNMEVLPPSKEVHGIS